MSSKWTVKRCSFISFLAFLFGVVFMGAGFLSAMLSAVLTPLGLAPFTSATMFGLFIMAGPMAGVLIRKKGSSLLGEVLAALAEMLYGSYFGPGVLLSGFIQGFGTELGFIVTGYKRFDTVPLVYGAIGASVLSFIYKFFQSGYGTYSLTFIMALFVVRLISAIIFGVVMVQLIMKGYNRVQRLENDNLR